MQTEERDTFKISACAWTTSEQFEQTATYDKWEPGRLESWLRPRKSRSKVPLGHEACWDLSSALHGEKGNNAPLFLHLQDHIALDQTRPFLSEQRAFYLPCLWIVAQNVEKWIHPSFKLSSSKNVREMGDVTLSPARKMDKNCISLARWIKAYLVRDTTETPSFLFTMDPLLYPLMNFPNGHSYRNVILWINADFKIKKLIKIFTHNPTVVFPYLRDSVGTQKEISSIKLRKTKEPIQGCLKQTEHVQISTYEMVGYMMGGKNITAADVQEEREKE